MPRNFDDITVDMKNTKRLVLAIISSLLLAAGFAQAAEKLDPVASDTFKRDSGQSLHIAPSCDGSCGIADDLN